MDTISRSQIEAILKDYSVATEANSDLVGAIQTYISVLLQWNQSISLTTVTDPSEIVRFHFGESLFAASVLPITHGRLADVGSGAGFPGLPLKMLVPALGLTLIESNAKKAAFLEEAIRRLGIRDVRVFHGRMEELKIGESEVPFEYVTARALGHFEDLLKWSHAHLARSGKIVLWLGEEDVASISCTQDWTWAAPARIPGSKKRFILVGARQG